MDREIRNHPYKTFSEQIDILESRNLVVKDRDFALTALESFSYYTLINGFKDLFLDKTSKEDKFVDGASFSMLYELHWIDLTMSNLLFKYTLSVEKRLKTHIGDVLADVYGIEESNYLEKKIYNPSKPQRGKYRDVIDAIDRSKSKDISAIHYMETEHNLPPWIALKAISFGSTVNWYSILPPTLKQRVMTSLVGHLPQMTSQEKQDFTFRLINQVYQYRNLSAHGNRSVLLKLDEEYRLSALHLKKVGLIQFFHGDFSTKNKDNLFSIMFSILTLMSDPVAAGRFLIELQAFLVSYDDPTFIFLGKDVYELLDIPRDTLSLLNDYYQLKFNN